MTNHPNRNALAILDDTDGGTKRCLPATAEKEREIAYLDRLTAGANRVVMTEGLIYGAATTRANAARVAAVTRDRVRKGLFRTYAANGLGEVIDFPAWIVT